MMKRKLCSVLLAFCMVLTLLPVSAMATDGATVSTADELTTAIASANDGDTITVSGEIAVNAPLVVTKTITLTGGSIVASDTFTSSSDKFTDFNLISLKTADKTLTLKDITLDAKQKALVVFCNKGKIVVDGATITGGKTSSYVAGVYMTSASQFEMNSGSITGNEVGDKYKNDNYTQYASDLWVGANAEGSLTAINGGTVGNIFVNSNEWSAKNPGGFTMNGGSVDNIYVEYDKGYGAAFTYTDGTINHLYLSTTTSGKSIEVSPVKGAAYKGGVPEDPVAQIGGSYYATLGEAVSAAENGDTITLLNNTSETISIPKNATVTLDLNGHDIAATSGCAIVNKGNLTVTGNGTVSTSAASSAAIANFPGAVANVNGGTYISDNWYVIKNLGKMVVDGPVTVKKPDGSTSTASLVDNGWVGSSDEVAGESVGAEDGKAKLTINSGEFSGKSGEKSCSVIKNDDYGVLEINGGTFDSTNNTGEGNAATILNWNVATINDGKFLGSYPLSNGAYTGNADQGQLTVTGGEFIGSRSIFGMGVGGNGKGAAIISGGTFDAPELNAVYDDAIGGYTVSISGGTFTDDPTDHVADGSIVRVDDDMFTVLTPDSNSLKNGTYTTDPSDFLAPGYSCYKNSDGTFTVYRPSAPSSGNTSSTTTKNPDGSTTTTTTDKSTGTVTETTKYPDGSTTTIETKKDGSEIETNKTANGSVGTIKTDADGNSEISANISAADVNDAAKKDESVVAPVSVAPAASSASAPVIKISVPASAGKVSVVIPVTNAQQGTVAVKVNPDGTEEIIKTSIVTKDGVVLGVEGSMQVKIVNNDKDFIDTVGHWAESDVDFVSARELFTGTAPQTFSPESDMTRGMVVTVLARLAGESTDGGANWYDKGCEWAVANGVSDGTDPNGSITREQLAAMLYRYFGSPAVSGSLSFADASSVSDYARDAMQWCVNNGIINGMDGLLNPQGQATRAQVSAMFARYIRLMATK